MTRKLLLKIDVSKINKNKIVDRKFTTKEGVEMVAKEYPLEVVMLDTTKLIKKYEDSDFMKVGFVAEGLTKEERTAKVKGVILGDVCEFVTRSTTPETAPTAIEYPVNDISAEDVPF